MVHSDLLYKSSYNHGGTLTEVKGADKQRFCNFFRIENQHKRTDTPKILSWEKCLVK